MKKLDLTKVSSVLSSRERAQLVLDYLSKEYVFPGKYKNQIAVLSSNIPSDDLSEFGFLLLLSRELDLEELSLELIYEKLSVLEYRLKLFHTALMFKAYSSGLSDVLSNVVDHKYREQIVTILKDSLWFEKNSEEKFVLKKSDLVLAIKEALVGVNNLYIEAFASYKAQNLIKSIYFDNQYARDNKVSVGKLCIDKAKKVVENHNFHLKLLLCEKNEKEMRGELIDGGVEELMQRKVKQIFDVCTIQSGFRPSNPFDTPIKSV